MVQGFFLCYMHQLSHSCFICLYHFILRQMKHEWDVFVIYWDVYIIYILCEPLILPVLITANDKTSYI